NTRLRQLRLRVKCRFFFRKRHLWPLSIATETLTRLSLPLQPRSCDLPWATNRRFLSLMFFRRSLVRGALRSRHFGPPLARVLGIRAAETSWNGEYFFDDFRRFAYWVSFQNGIATWSSATMPW